MRNSKDHRTNCRMDIGERALLVLPILLRDGITMDLHNRNINRIPSILRMNTIPRKVDRHSRIRHTMDLHRRIIIRRRIPMCSNRGWKKRLFFGKSSPGNIIQR
jgi:hypothetical protein